MVIHRRVNKLTVISGVFYEVEYVYMKGYQGNLNQSKSERYPCVIQGRPWRNFPGFILNSISVNSDDISIVNTKPSTQEWRHTGQQRL